MSLIGRRWLTAAAKLVLTLALMCGAFYLLDWQELRDTVSRVNTGAFILAVVILLPENIILAIRWHLIVRPYIALPMYTNVRHYLIYVCLNFFTPGQVGGDIYRFYSLKSPAMSGWMIAGTILRERLIGVAGYALFFVVCFVIYLTANDGATPPKIYWLGLAAFVLGLVSLTLAKPILHFTENWRYPFLRSLRAQLGETLSVALDMGSLRFLSGIQALSLLTCAAWTLAILVVARDFELPTSFLILGMAGVLTDLIRALPITIQGIGVREGVFAFLLSTTGVTLEEGFAVGATTYLAMTAAVILAGALGFFLPKYSSTTAQN